MYVFTLYKWVAGLSSWPRNVISYGRVNFGTNEISIPPLVRVLIFYVRLPCWPSVLLTQITGVKLPKLVQGITFLLGCRVNNVPVIIEPYFNPRVIVPDATN